MSGVEAFIAGPSQGALDALTKEQLLVVADHFSVVVVGDKRLKDNIKAAIKSKLVALELMSGEEEVISDSDSVAATASRPGDPVVPTVSVPAHGLTFEQQREILLLQLEHDKMKELYDRHSVCHDFSPGDQVLALLPIVGSPFQAKYAGPYTVVKKVSDLNYIIATPGRRKAERLCHVNLLKPYYTRVESSLSQELSDGVRPALAVASVVDECDGVPELDESLLCRRLKNSELLGNLD